MLYGHARQKYLLCLSWLQVSELGVSRLRIWVFKTEQDKLFVLSIILCADNIATYASLHQMKLTG